MNLPAASPSRIAIIGTGRAARAGLRSAAGGVVCVVGRDPGRAGSASSLGANAIASPFPAGLRDTQFDVLWILTSDSSIRQVLEAVLAAEVPVAGRLVVHSSGMLPLTVLAPARAAGAAIAALHPAASLTGEEPIPKDTLWAGSAEGIELAEAARLLLNIPEQSILLLDDDARPLYHAASSSAANYSVTLFALSVELFRRAGIDAEAATLLTRQYLETSARRSAEHGTAAAVTGPIIRGDDAVVASQLAAVRDAMPEAEGVFEEMAELTRKLFGGR